MTSTLGGMFFACGAFYVLAMTGAFAYWVRRQRVKPGALESDYRKEKQMLKDSDEIKGSDEIPERFAQPCGCGHLSYSHASGGGCEAELPSGVKCDCTGFDDIDWGPTPAAKEASSSTAPA